MLPLLFEADRDELLLFLEVRWRAFHRLPQYRQDAINASRFLPVDETQRLLRYYMWNRRFPDEARCYIKSTLETERRSQ